MVQNARNLQINEKLAEALNEHVSIEAESAFMYHSMASWAEVRGLTGFAAWFRSEAKIELDHMLQFVSHMNDRGYQTTFRDLPAPPAEWSDATTVFETVVKIERRLCERIEGLIELSHGQRDHFTGSFLQGFVPQQIADTAEADAIHDRLRIVGNDGHGVILIDQELKANANANR